MKFESKFEQSGDIFEWQFIGQVDTKNPDYQVELQKVREEEAEEGMKDGYIRFRKSLELAKKFQPYDPANPDKPLARDLRIAMQDALKLEKPEEMDWVKFYTASGTPLDKLHGVDAFLEVEDPEQKKTYRATFDLTVNPQKRAYKSDVVVLEKDLPDPNAEEKEYLAAIENIASEALKKMIAREVKEKKGVLFGKNQ